MGLLVKTKPNKWLLVGAMILYGLAPVHLSQADEWQDGRNEPGPEPELFLPAPVSISSDQQMDFGQLADKDGSVVLGLTDLITSDPSYISYGGAPYSGICTITGDPGVGVDISMSSTPNSGFSLSNFVTSEGSAPLVNVIIDGTGTLVLTIGATLTVDAATASIGPGQVISYTITSTYN